MRFFSRYKYLTICCGPLFHLYIKQNLFVSSSKLAIDGKLVAVVVTNSNKFLPIEALTATDNSFEFERGFS